jgi:hypothetical protein
LPGRALPRLLIAETRPVAERLRVREIDDDEGRRLVRIVRRGSGSVVTWRRAQMVSLSAQGMDVVAIAKVAFISEDRVRDVIRNFSADGFGSPYPRYKGGRPQLADFLVAERVADERGECGKWPWCLRSTAGTHHGAPARHIAASYP